MEHEPHTEHLTMRVPRRVVEELASLSAARGLPPTALARRYVDEGIRMDRHPGIVFIDRAAGRRASIAGRRIDVWQVIETLQASNGNVEETAEYLRLRIDQVQTAIAYAADFPDEVEAMIRANREEADRLMEADARQSQLLRR